MEGFIAGIGWVGSSGCGWGSQGGECCLTDTPLPKLSRRDVFPAPNQRFGRQSEYSKVGLAALAFALRDAGLEEWSVKRSVSVTAATVHGCLATDLDYYRTVLLEGGALASPNLFAFTLANCFLGEAAIQFGLTGSLMAINEGEPNGLGALRVALEELALGEAEAALAGICDLPVPPEMTGGDRVPPGAVFVALTRSEPTPESCYGKVSLLADGTLTLDGAPVASLLDLVTRALAQRGPQVAASGVDGSVDHPEETA